MTPVEAIHFFSEDTDYKVQNATEISQWISDVIEAEGESLAPVSFIICSDDYLHEMNVQYLEHDTLTDVITFDYSSDEGCSGDVFISIDRIRDNADEMKVAEADELHRVMVHGVLHLLGYKDKTPEDARIIRSKEDNYLSLRAF